VNELLNATVEAAPASFHRSYELVQRAGLELNRLHVEGAGDLGLVTVPGADDCLSRATVDEELERLIEGALTTAKTSIRGSLLGRLPPAAAVAWGVVAAIRRPTH
jgi:hypothetical protein